MSSLSSAMMPTGALDTSRWEISHTPAGATVIVPKGKGGKKAGHAHAHEDEGAPAGAAGAAAADGSFFAAMGAAAAAVGASTGAHTHAHTHAPKAYKPSDHDLETRFQLCRSVGEECIQEDELLALLRAKTHPTCYDGFEPSGRMHIAQGIYKAILVNRLTAAGCVFKFWVADWFALLNNKMGGDLKKIRTVGEYMIEVWKAAGMDMTNVEFLWASDEINSRANDYWLRVIDIARRFNVPRIVRCCTIMGRKESDDLSAAQIFYPCMQCADVFFLKADICQLGMDQRKVNMLAREYCDAAEPKIKHKPVILSHHMLMGLAEGQEKMSKSDPDSAIFMEDSPEDVKRKIKKAYCPPGMSEKNPCLDWSKYIIFGKYNEMTVERSEANGGNITYPKYEDLEADYVGGKLHPGDLKATLIKYINGLLEPVRAHFASGHAKELLEKVRKYRITR